MSRSAELDWMIDRRIRWADTRERHLTVDALHEGILEYIAVTAFEHQLARADVPCPPLERWGERPLPQPTRLRMYSRRVYDSLWACVQGEFNIVQASMRQTIPVQPTGSSSPK